MSKQVIAPKLGENKMGTMPIGKLLVNMATPMIVAMLVQALYNVVDSYFVSRISEDTAVKESAIAATKTTAIAQVRILLVSFMIKISFRFFGKNPLHLSFDVQYYTTNQFLLQALYHIKVMKFCTSYQLYTHLICMFCTITAYKFRAANNLCRKL